MQHRAVFLDAPQLPSRKLDSSEYFHSFNYERGTLATTVYCLLPPYCSYMGPLLSESAISVNWFDLVLTRKASRGVKF